MPKITQAKKRRMWHKAIIALMNEPTVAAAAAAVKIHESTLELWMRDPEFIEQFRTAQQTALGHGLAMVELNFGKNVRNLQEISEDKTVNAATRAAASGKLIDIAIGLSKQRSNAKYVQQFENELRRLNSPIVEEVIDDDEEEETGKARKTSRQLELPPPGGTFGSDGDGGPPFDTDTEGEEGAEGDS